MTIKHLVISGGGPSMLQSLGAIQYLNSTDFINIENIKSIQRLLSSNSGSILKCIKDAFDLLRQPDGVGPAALKAIQDAQQGIKNLQPVFQGKEKKPRIDQVEAEGPRGAGGGKQRKTRFRKRQTQKRKTRKNRKQRK